jgi:hypothetical protein
VRVRVCVCVCCIAIIEYSQQSSLQESAGTPIPPAVPNFKITFELKTPREEYLQPDETRVTGYTQRTVHDSGLSKILTQDMVDVVENNQNYALNCTTPFFNILVPTCFDSSLPSSGSFLDPSELLEIQIE